MTVEQMIQFLRLSVYVQDKDKVVAQDPAYLCMTDEELLLYLNLAMSRNYPDTPSLVYLPEEALYGVVILAKKELYYTLAVKEAPLFDMGADNNNYLKRSQRFDHYMALLQQADKEYDDWLENGGEDGIGTVKSYNVTLSDRYGTRYNYENAAVPKVTLYIGTVTDNTIEFWWSVKNISRFYRYKVYISTEPIVDLFNLKSHIADGAKLVAEIKDIHQVHCRVRGLDPKTTYYIAIQATNMASLCGYAQTEVITGPFDEESSEPTGEPTDIEVTETEESDGE